MTDSRLAALLDQATRERPGLGPPTREETLARFFISDNAVDMARLLVDMAAWVDEERCAAPHCEPICEHCRTPDALLARFAEIERRAAQ